jgi:uncharacterized protein (TIGR03382 family)
VIPSGGCTTDDQCPAGGICVSGECILATPCVADTDCQPDEQCSPDNRCLARPTGMCEDSADCGDLACLMGTCSACTADTDCQPDGRCIADTGGVGGGYSLAPGEEVQGGACTCETAGSTSSGWPAALLMGMAGCAMVLRRRRSTNR